MNLLLPRIWECPKCHARSNFAACPNCGLTKSGMDLYRLWRNTWQTALVLLVVFGGSLLIAVAGSAIRERFFR